MPGYYYPEDGPPPRQRPWSPNDYDYDERAQPHDYDAYLGGSSQADYRRPYRSRTALPRREREPSDVSVEALDLADYAQTLRRHPEHDPYNYPPPRQYTPPRHHTLSPERQRYPPTSFSPPIIDRPFSALSRDTIQPPPSLVSGGASGTSHSSHAESAYQALRRPQSLPPITSSNDFLPLRPPAHFASPTPPHPSYGRNRFSAPVEYVTPEPDLQEFPAWSRGWYEQRRQLEEEDKELFGGMDFPAPSALGTRSGDGYGYAAHSSSAPASARGMVPWGAQLGESNHTITDSVKEERMRMLEREFGNKPGGPSKTNAWPEEGAVGSVDNKGMLITDGPRKRIAARWVQGILALGAAISSLYSAFVTKPLTPPPPAGKPATILLYVLSIITFLIVIYVFAIRPCCGGRIKVASGPGDPAAAGMMVLPVMAGKNGKGGKKGKKGKKGEPGALQVNLIVDPTMFGNNGTGRGRGRGDEFSDEEERYGDDGDPAPPGSYRAAPSKRRSIFQGLALEKSWKRARSEMKWRLGVDIVMMILWGAEFVLILLNDKCPAGGFNGWCDGYNVATAATCLLCVAFGIGVFFDIKDLHMSRVSPRSRT